MHIVLDSDTAIIIFYFSYRCTINIPCNGGGIPLNTIPMVIIVIPLRNEMPCYIFCIGIQRT